MHNNYSFILTAAMLIAAMMCACVSCHCGDDDDDNNDRISGDDTDDVSDDSQTGQDDSAADDFQDDSAVDDVADDADDDTGVVYRWTYEIVDYEGDRDEFTAEDQGLDDQWFPGNEFERYKVLDFYTLPIYFYIWLDFLMPKQMAFHAFEIADPNDPDWFYQLVAEKPVYFLTDGEVGETIANTSWGTLIFNNSVPIPYNVVVESTIKAKDVTVTVPLGTIEGCTQIETKLTEIQHFHFVFGTVTYWMHPYYSLVKAEKIPYYNIVQLKAVEAR